MKHTIIALTAASFMITACTTNPYTGEQQVSNTAIGAGTGALLGTAAGAILGSTTHLKTRKTMLIGAGLGMTALAILAGRSGSLILFTLAGVILSSLTGALTSLLISLAPTPFASSEIVTWLMGALMDRSWEDVRIALPVSVLGMVALLWAARSLDALTLGDAAARSLGVNMTRLQWLIVIGIGMTVGSSVAVAGIIGFVGLVVPHLVRPLVGHQPSALLIPSALAGALLVVLADCLVRILPSTSEVRLGIAMASLGTPFFMMLLFKMRREVA